MHLPPPLQLHSKVAAKWNPNPEKGKGKGKDAEAQRGTKRPWEEAQEWGKGDGGKGPWCARAHDNFVIEKRLTLYIYCH